MTPEVWVDPLPPPMTDDELREVLCDKHLRELGIEPKPKPPKPVSWVQYGDDDFATCRDCQAEVPIELIEVHMCEVGETP